MVLALVLVLVPVGFYFGVLPKLRALGSPQVNALFPWAGSTQQTAVNAGNAGFANQQDTVDPSFQAYYTSHSGSATLGTPLTPGIPTSSGIVQLYTAGGLLAKGTTKGTPSAKTGLGDTALQFVGMGPSLAGAGVAPAATAAPKGTPGTSSGASNVVAVPLVAALLKAGGNIAVADGASTTYVDLRSAAMPDQLISGTMPSPLPTNATQPVFIATDTQGGQSLGHAIPPAIWAYITSSSVSPAGWQTDIGAPLTEALAVTASQSGTTHHLLIQAFWNAVVVADADTLTGTHPSISLASTGLAYLKTLGPPTVTLPANASAWALGNTPVLDAAATGKETVHIGANFPVTPTGQTSWTSATLWYAVSWSAGKQSGKGWLAGTALTFTAPNSSQPAYASLDVLSPDLAAYVSARGKNMGVAVYDITRNAYYSYNDTATFYLASTAKVYIMASYLDMLEGQGRSPRSDEVASLTRMIENSNNDDAQLLFDRLGGSQGQQKYLQQFGITDYGACGYGWGCAQLSPADAVHILTLLQQGKILNDSDRKLAFNLMGNIESDMQWGVGDTAPKGATFYMKDGWLQYPDDPWDLNSVGIVTQGNETYAIAVYSENNPTFDWSKVEHVCGTVAQLLTS